MKNQHEIIIDQDRCIGCGSCISDCVMHYLELVDAKAAVVGTNCITCGHCFAVCPKNAITISGFEAEEIIPVNDSDHPDSDLLLNTIKSRRSIRQFKDTPVEKKKILKIIEAGRYTPTAINRQDVSYLVITKKLRRTEKLAVDFFRKIQQEEKNALNSWFFDDAFFFKGAPCAIVLLSDHTVDGALAAANMELMANALGLGVLYSGFFTTAFNKLPEIRKLLGVNENETAVTTLVLGYPNVTYYRSVPREKAKVREA